ncbi:MAG TPA: hypothetical protein VJK52_05045, partial [Candidatus Nanoarchaeia archaeon]|nr:hypothetical protein [Candidatus Nanoarchaeia archaeon]
IDEYRTTITNLQKEATAKSAKLAETISKCNSLERRKDSAICNAFLADAQVQLSASKATLAAEQEDLDQAIANNIQSRILKNQRKVAKAQAAATKMQAIYDELQVHCR